jgi:hypothetical protein
MHRNALLTLLVLALASACGGKGERSSGGLEDLAVEDQSPPRDDQQAPPSSDRPPSAEPDPATEDSCESLCDAVQGYCPTGGAAEFVGMSECVASCRGGTIQFSQCDSDYLAVLRCIIRNGLLSCGGEIDEDQASAVCTREVGALTECVGFVESDDDQVQ